MSEACVCGRPAVSFGLVVISQSIPVQLTPAWPNRSEAEAGAAELSAWLPDMTVVVAPLCHSSEAYRDLRAKQAVSHLN